MAKKRKKSKAAKNKAKILAAIRTSLVKTLNELAEGKTPPDKVKAHVAFYESCNETEKEILETIFKAEDSKDYDEITAFFAEKLK